MKHANAYISSVTHDLPFVVKTTHRELSDEFHECFQSQKS